MFTISARWVLVYSCLFGVLGVIQDAICTKHIVSCFQKPHYCAGKLDDARRAVDRYGDPRRRSTGRGAIRTPLALHGCLVASDAAR